MKQFFKKSGVYQNYLAERENEYNDQVNENQQNTDEMLALKSKFTNLMGHYSDLAEKVKKQDAEAASLNKKAQKKEEKTEAPKEAKKEAATAAPKAEAKTSTVQKEEPKKDAAQSLKKSKSEVEKAAASKTPKDTGFELH
jgi:chromosome segregation ATPase